ncbi:uncharacterized protein LOC111688364 [Lucilia cuprina]|uniref:uncharacterized protein LOC111688364 n=1 Tax=Lucilia cuprina TaxID=7375 RepID=UPI001F0509EF|nr:uncharacterized protein LOC111688364 [Lucilia cuprina]
MSHRRYLALIKQREDKQPNDEHENPYSHTVLIGNWFEERFASKIDHKAITPGIYGASKCLAEETLYKNDFKLPIKDPKKYDEFIEWKQQGFSNRLNSEKTNIKLCDGDQFKQNITSFKDVMYRIMPQEDKGEEGIKKSKINEDYMRSFGNSTQTGLLQWLECERKRDDAIPLDVSHYKNNFKPMKITKKIILHKGEQRKTSIL